MDSNVLSLDSIRDFMVLKGGRVTNHELVQHFKEVLTDPVTRDEARIRFKEYINTLATLTRDSEGGKQLVLKKRFRMSHPELQSGSTSPAIPSSLPISPLQAPSLNLQYQPVYHTSHDSIDSLVSPLRHTYRRLSQDSLGSYSLKSPVTPTLTTPTYKGPIAAPIGLKRNISQDSVFGSSIFEASTSSMKEADPPPVPPRRKSSDKMRLDYPPEEQKPVESAVVPSSAPPPQETLPTDIENKENVADENKISVKERMQKFDRMASESALNKTSLQNNNSKKRHERVDKDEDDSGSVALLDGKSKEWIVKCAQCDYQAIVKMAAENPKLIKLKVRIFNSQILSLF
ncbi:uncharacterized protein LOC112126787 [Cimex lectularius]|uniref:SOWAHA-C winged helix-turn-helix domain-containing protein n=1 Tax=Cimex lectularius TaxID=79782 RepID=A0A8I6SGU6_CIMLE|nr:uncharacterized protein LOC112126787 [Cimex lectularius]